MPSVAEFAAKIKSKYPVYVEVDDYELTNKILNKYPQYRDKVDTSEPIPQDPIGTMPPESSHITGGMYPMPTTVVEDKMETPMAPTGEQPSLTEALLPSSTTTADVFSQPPVDVNITPTGQGPLAEYQEQGVPTLEATGDGQMTYSPKGDPIVENIPTLERTGLTPDEQSISAGMGLVTDVTSLPERVAGATFNKEQGKTFMQELSNPEASVTKELKQALSGSNLPPILKFAGETLLSMGSDPTIIGGLAKTGLKSTAKKVGSKVAKVADKVLGEGSVGRLKKIDLRPSNIAAEAGELATSMNKETLRKWGTVSGRKELREAYNTQGDIGQDVVEFLDAFDERFPEHKQVNKMLNNMGSIKLKDVIKTLNEGKIKNPTPVNARKNEAIDGLISKIEQKIKLPDTKFSWSPKEIRKTTNPMGATIQPKSVTPGGSRTVTGKTIKKTELVAKEFRDLRKQLDDEISGAFDKDFRSGYETALIGGRTTMMQNLKKAAKDSGNPEYVKLMDEYHKKVEAVVRVKKLFGKNKEARLDNAENVIAGLHRFGKTRKSKALDDLDLIYGKEFANKTRLAAEARQIGTAGKDELVVPWGPKFQTGAKYTAMALAGIGSPKIISRVIGGLGLAERVVGKAFGKGYGAIKGRTAWMPFYKLVENLSRSEKRRLETLAKAYNKKPTDKIEKELRLILKK